MRLAAECFKKVKKDCIKFIKSQETSKEKFINKEVDYFKLSENCINNWQQTCTPDIVGDKQLNIYKELLNV